MRVESQILLVVLIFMSISCKKNNPTEPVIVKPKYFYAGAYGETLDSLFTKTWSDGSWEKYSKRAIVNGSSYTVTVNSSGTEYYYSNKGYSGFKPTGSTIILFDKPLGYLPDTLAFGGLYIRTTSFYYQGYNYTANFENIMIDTSAVAIPLGIFQTCIQMKNKSTITVSTQTEIQNTEIWIAKGPGTIKELLNSGTVIVMSGGHVNGIQWGGVSNQISKYGAAILAKKQVQNNILPKSYFRQIQR